MSEGTRNRKRQAPSGSSNVSMTNEEPSGDEVSFPGTNTFELTKDGGLTRKPAEPRRRRRFGRLRREEVARVRSVGACLDCRRRKVRCRHVLQGTDLGTDASQAPDLSSPWANHGFNYESDFAIPSQWSKPDENHQLNAPLPEDVDIPGSVPTPLGRREEVAQYVRDFENIIDNNVTVGLAGEAHAIQWPQELDWMSDTPLLMGAEPYPPLAGRHEPSNDTRSAQGVWPSFSSPADSVDAASAYTQDDLPYRCNQPGCAGLAWFADELGLRNHQVKHAHQYRLGGTFPCPVEDCYRVPYIREENLLEHMRVRHPQDVGGRVTFPPAEPSVADAQLDKVAQVQSFLAGGYVPGMEDGRADLARRPHNPVDEVSAQLEKFRTAASSRGDRSVTERSQGAVPRGIRKQRLRRMGSAVARRDPVHHAGHGQPPPPATDGGPSYATAMMMGHPDRSMVMTGVEVPNLSIFTAMTPDQPVLSGTSRYFTSAPRSAVESPSPSFEVGGSLSEFPAGDPMWGDGVASALDQGFSGMYGAPHRIPSEPSGPFGQPWTQQNQAASMPVELDYLTPVDSPGHHFALARAGFGRDFTRPRAESPLQPPPTFSSFQDHRFEREAPRQDFMSMPPRPPPKSYRYDGATTGFASTSMPRRAHQRTPSIALNDELIDPLADLDLSALPGEYQPSPPYSFPKLEYSHSYSGSLSSSQGNDSLLSVVNPVQAIKLPPSANMIDVPGAGDGVALVGDQSYAMFGTGSGQEKFVHTMATEIKVDDGEVARAGAAIGVGEWDDLVMGTWDE